MSISLVQFAERPTSEDELQISEIIHTFVSALNEKNISKISGLIDDEARIEIAFRPGVFLSKNEYLSEVERLAEHVRRFTYRNVLIRIQENKREAVVYFDVTRKPYESITDVISSRYLRCKQNKSIWVIYEAGLIG